MEDKNKIRIAKFLASLNVCSRREAERLIAAGNVSVNGEVIETPVCFVNDADTICVCGEVVAGRSLRAENALTSLDCRASRPIPRLWAYYKPRGEITTHHDPQNRRTVFESARAAGLGRVISVGRLDINSEGLLLLTNCCALAHELEYTAKKQEKVTRVYRVRAFGNLAEALRVIEKRRYGKAHLVCNKQTLVFPVFPPYKKPKKRCPLLYSCVSPITKRNDVSCVLDRVVIDGFSYEPITIVFPLNAVSADDPRPRNAWCSVILTEGKNREIRKIFNALNLHVSRLIRISYGDFSLHEITPTLNAGDFREFHFTEKRGALL